MLFIKGEPGGVVFVLFYRIPGPFFTCGDCANTAATAAHFIYYVFMTGLKSNKPCKYNDDSVFNLGHFVRKSKRSIIVTMIFGSLRPAPSPVFYTWSTAPSWTDFSVPIPIAILSSLRFVSKDVSTPKDNQVYERQNFERICGFFSQKGHCLCQSVYFLNFIRSNNLYHNTLRSPWSGRQKVLALGRENLKRISGRRRSNFIQIISII